MSVPFIATLIKNNQPYPLGLPEPFRGVLAPGQTAVSRLPLDRVKHHLFGRGLTQARELALSTKQILVPSDAEFSRHCPPIDEWTGEVTTSGATSADIVWAGDAAGKLRFIPGYAATYQVELLVLARRTDAADAAAYNTWQMVETDGDGNFLANPTGNSPVADGETDSSWSYTGGFSVGTPFYTITVQGAANKNVRWRARAKFTMVGGY